MQSRIRESRGVFKVGKLVVSDLESVLRICTKKIGCAKGCLCPYRTVSLRPGRQYHVACSKCREFVRVSSRTFITSCLVVQPRQARGNRYIRLRLRPHIRSCSPFGLDLQDNANLRYHRTLYNRCEGKATKPSRRRSFAQPQG
jgi:hypothetical protein